MKTTIKRTIGLLFVSGFLACSAYGDPPDVKWKELQTEQLKKHLVGVRTFQDVFKLLGEPRSSDFSTTGSTAVYGVGRSSTLIFSGDRDYHVVKDNAQRPIHKISFYTQAEGAPTKLVWRININAPDDPRIPDNHLDSAPTDGATIGKGGKA